MWSRSRGAQIKLRPEAGTEIANCGSGSFLFTMNLKKFGRNFAVTKKLFYIKYTVYVGTVVFLKDGNQ